MRAVLPLLLLPATALAGDPVFPRSQYGNVDLRMPQSTLSLESVLGTNPNFERIADYDPADRISLMARPVGRLDVLMSVGGVATCTASLLPGGYVLTNHHCVPGEEGGVVLEASLLLGYIHEGDPAGTERYMIDPKPAETNEELDYSLLRVVGVDPSVRWGSVRIDARDPRPGESLIIIHHPAGLAEHVTRGGCRADAPNPLSGDDIHHRCDTLGGSSGSPVFSDSSGAMIGLHYAGSLGPGLSQFNLAKRMSQVVSHSPILARLFPQAGSAPVVSAPVQVSHAGDVASSLRVIPDPGSSTWDDGVRSVLVGTFDTNASGNIDQSGELARIGCPTWVELDRLVRQRWTAGMYLTYGFNPTGGTFLGGSWGLDPGLGIAIAAVLDRCGLAAAPEAARHDLVAEITGLPDDASFVASAARVLAGGFDVDRTGSIDRPGEAQAVTCEVWAALDGKVRRQYKSGVAEIFGFDNGYLWMGGALGFTESTRSAALTTLRSCGLTADTASGGSSGGAAAGAPTSAVLAVPPDTTAWSSQVRQILLAAHDRNHNGVLDGDAELRAVSCEEWSAVDEVVRGQWSGTGVAQIYGFETDAIWVGDALGFAASLRKPALDAIGRCGLR